jgi:hypothetical protein
MGLTVRLLHYVSIRLSRRLGSTLDLHIIHHLHCQPLPEVKNHKFSKFDFHHLASLLFDLKNKDFKYINIMQSTHSYMPLQLFIAEVFPIFCPLLLIRKENI